MTVDTKVIKGLWEIAGNSYIFSFCFGAKPQKFEVFKKV